MLLSGATIVGVYATATQAEDAVREMTAAGIDIRDLSVIGQGSEAGAQPMGFSWARDRVRAWGRRGVLWSGLWGLLVTGVVMTVPMLGQVVIVGHLAVMTVGAIGIAATIGSRSVLGLALLEVGIPRTCIGEYEKVLRADRFLVIARGTRRQGMKARALMDDAGPLRLDTYPMADPENDASRPA